MSNFTDMIKTHAVALVKIDHDLIEQHKDPFTYLEHAIQGVRIVAQVRSLSPEAMEAVTKLNEKLTDVINNMESDVEEKKNSVH